MSNNTTMRRLGDYIQQVDERNSNGEISLSQGICNQKYFQDPKQVSATPHLDKIVRTGQFAYNRATTRNGDKISIALREGPDCTVSSAYCVFFITDENVIDPHWLWLWFKRPEFDRYAIFKSHGSAHEFFEFETMCNVMLPVPPIEEQREIVARHKAIEHKIDVNRRLIAKLEETARTIYRHTFVENIDPENLPEGWRLGKLIDIVHIQYGYAFEGELFNSDGVGRPIIRIRNIPSGTTNDFTEEIAPDKYIIHRGDLLIGMDGDFHINLWLSDESYLVQRSCCVRPIDPVYLGYIIEAIKEPIAKFQDSIVGATVIHLSKKDLDSIELIIPPKDKVVNLDTLAKLIFHLKVENRNLSNLI